MVSRDVIFSHPTTSWGLIDVTLILHEAKLVVRALTKDSSMKSWQQNCIQNPVMLANIYVKRSSYHIYHQTNQHINWRWGSNPGYYSVLLNKNWIQKSADPTTMATKTLHEFATCSQGMCKELNFFLCLTTT